MIQRAFREALLALPAEEYDWFDIRARMFRSALVAEPLGLRPWSLLTALSGAPEPPLGEPRRREFFEYAGPYSASRSRSPPRLPASMKAANCARCRAIAPAGASSGTSSSHGGGPRACPSSQAQRPSGYLPRARRARRQQGRGPHQGDTVATADAVVTVTEELLATFGQTTVPAQGLPGYSFERAAGESWRSRLDAKELIMRNVAGTPTEQLLDRMIELSSRTEEHCERALITEQG